MALPCTAAGTERGLRVRESGQCAAIALCSLPAAADFVLISRQLLRLSGDDDDEQRQPEAAPAAPVAAESEDEVQRDAALVRQLQGRGARRRHGAPQQGRAACHERGLGRIGRLRLGQQPASRRRQRGGGCSRRKRRRGRQRRGGRVAQQSLLLMAGCPGVAVLLLLPLLVLLLLLRAAVEAQSRGSRPAPRCGQEQGGRGRCSGRGCRGRGSRGGRGRGRGGVRAQLRWLCRLSGQRLQSLLLLLLRQPLSAELLCLQHDLLIHHCNRRWRLRRRERQLGRTAGQRQDAAADGADSRPAGVRHDGCPSSLYCSLSSPWQQRQQQQQQHDSRTQPNTRDSGVTRWG